jgi:hypothetical protein
VDMLTSLLAGYSGYAGYDMSGYDYYADRLAMIAMLEMPAGHVH